MLGSLLEFLLFIGSCIGSFALGEPVHKDSSLGAAKNDDRPVTSRSALPWPADALLYNAAAEISIDLSRPSALHGIRKYGIVDVLLSSKPLEPFCFEDSWFGHQSFCCRFIVLSTTIKLLL